MRFLITNDDGILAHGIECLIEAAEPLGDVYVVAPDREQSATSHSLTLHHPLRPVRRAERRWQIDGTPTGLRDDRRGRRCSTSGRTSS